MKTGLLPSSDHWGGEYWKPHHRPYLEVLKSLETQAADLFECGLYLPSGTCLRACYGSSRLREDLDFTGGIDFNRQTLTDLGQVLVQSLEEKIWFTCQCH